MERENGGGVGDDAGGESRGIGIETVVAMVTRVMLEVADDDDRGGKDERSCIGNDNYEDNDGGSAETSGRGRKGRSSVMRGRVLD